MVFHILANAIKFNKETGGLIDVILSYAQKGTPGGGHLKCKVCDNGQGMTPKQIEQSYEAFGNVKIRDKVEKEGEDEKKQNEEDENSTGKNVMTTSGIGLGISTSYKLATAMNGDLSIVSKKRSEESDVSGTQVTMFIECFKVEEQDNLNKLNQE